MTIEEAKTAISKGEKVTHNYFSSDEFITMKGGVLIDENDYYLDWDEFWLLRDTVNWKNGWEIFK